jgi:ribosomal protein S21
MISNNGKLTELSINLTKNNGSYIEAVNKGIKKQLEMVEKIEDLINNNHGNLREEVGEVIPRVEQNFKSLETVLEERQKLLEKVSKDNVKVAEKLENVSKVMNERSIVENTDNVKRKEWERGMTLNTNQIIQMLKEFNVEEKVKENVDLNREIFEIIGNVRDLLKSSIVISNERDEQMNFFEKTLQEFEKEINESKVTNELKEKKFQETLNAELERNRNVNEQSIKKMLDKVEDLKTDLVNKDMMIQSEIERTRRNVDYLNALQEEKFSDINEILINVKDPLKTS